MLASYIVSILQNNLYYNLLASSKKHVYLTNLTQVFIIHTLPLYPFSHKELNYYKRAGVNEYENDSMNLSIFTICPP